MKFKIVHNGLNKHEFNSGEEADKFVSELTKGKEFIQRSYPSVKGYYVDVYEYEDGTQDVLVSAIEEEED